jgi:hypothetical protein
LLKIIICITNALYPNPIHLTSLKVPRISGKTVILNDWGAATMETAAYPANPTI